ncbi:MAG: Rieske 2Fe-2S domain-containing protein [Euryarchaeota archaeon]|nr:Rieske 2Fe-2S domain-containing protein [Euryarchaeota archaeon]
MGPEEGLTRRMFLKVTVGAAAVGALASTAAATFLSLAPYKKPGIKLKEAPFLYTADDTAIKLKVWYASKVGQEAVVSDFTEAGMGAQATWNGFPAVLIRIDPRKSLNLGGAASTVNDQGFTFPVVPNAPGVEQNIVALWGTCPHACCRPNWRVSRPEVQNLIWCICHDSRYDPHAIVTDNYKGKRYRGAMWQGGPAKRALPQIPIKIVDGRIIGAPEKPDWYVYCGVDVE